ncbi:conserved hypothetical protein [Gammaproteobacteria bacterium]
MRFHIPTLALTTGILWGAAIFIVGAVNLISPPYGRAFLELVASLYPGYHPGPGILPIVIASLYGLVDGSIGGACFGWLYNGLLRLTGGQH